MIERIDIQQIQSKKARILEDNTTLDVDETTDETLGNYDGEQMKRTQAMVSYETLEMMKERTINIMKNENQAVVVTDETNVTNYRKNENIKQDADQVVYH